MKFAGGVGMRLVFQALGERLLDKDSEDLQGRNRIVSDRIEITSFFK
jgi:hypothetical protein